MTLKKPMGSNLMAFARFAKQKNKEARQDPDNICSTCGKPKTLYFTPTVGGRVQRNDGSEHIDGLMVSPQTQGLCCCK